MTCFCVFGGYFLKDDKNMSFGKGEKMRHILKISVSKKAVNDGVAACRTVTVRERLLRFLFGMPQKLTVIVPGDSIEELLIKEVGADYGMSKEPP